jgi:hypothetical protein
VVELIDVRELSQAWTIRMKYKCRSPMTGSQRAVLDHDLKDLSHHSEIISALGLQEETTSTVHLGCMSTLRAAVEMTKSDAGSRNWLGTLEQIDGGAYNGVSGSSTVAHAASAKSVTPANDGSLLHTKALPAEQVKSLCTQYHEEQFIFEKCLLEFRDQLCSDNKKSHFKTLVDLRVFDSQKPHRLIIKWKHPEVLEIVSEIQGKTVSSAAVTLLRTTIAHRETVVRHFQNLSGRTTAREKRKNKSHRRFLDILKTGEATLLGLRRPEFGKSCQKRPAEDDLVEDEGRELVQHGAPKRKRQKKD